ncbi:MAG TPA: GNAT family N-acetyltransferase [Flavisolibacter sp.]|jgi:phosphinothricin acetyltransferase|nr:GNAT family N-acetyltransferase [Flavisolibacter sp.]
MYIYQSLNASHWHQVKKIYLEGIETGQATFQKDATSWEVWDQGHLSHSRIAALLDRYVVGWAALSPVSAKPHYAGVAEVSVYIGVGYRGKGLGFQLLRELVRESEQNGIWTLQASIFPENVASVHIHKKCGFRLLGRREKIAQLNGVWRDTVIWERRSNIVGI